MKNETIDDTKEEIIMSKAFAKEAGIYSSEAYNMLKGLRPTSPRSKSAIRKNPKAHRFRTFLF